MQNVLKLPDLTPFTNAVHFFPVWMNLYEVLYKTVLFSNRLSGFTGDQSNYGCLQVGAQGKIVFTMTLSTLFSSGGFE